MRWGSMHLGGLSFFRLWRVGKWAYWIFFIGFNVFPSSSHQVFNVFSTCSPNPQCVHQHVPNGSSFYRISFALSSTLVTHVISPKEILTYIFWECPKVDYFFFLLGWSMMPITNNQKKKLLRFPQLINMSHNMGY
jgi:hypothetical protein